MSSGRTLSQESFAEQRKTVLTALRKASLITLGLALILWLSTCFVQVKVQETGVLLQWGRVINKRVESGLAVKLPWPIQELARVKTREIRRIRTGFGADPEKVREFETKYGSVDNQANSTLLIPYVLTGDKNMLHIKVVLSYRVSDPVIYLYRIADVDGILRDVALHGILIAVSSRHVDQLLTSGKIEMRRKLMKYLSEKCRELKLGLDLVSVEIKNVRPPAQTAAAFKSVINAQEEQRELLHQATSYRNRVLPETRALAHKIIQEAASKREERINHAQGRARRFAVLAAKYIEEPALTRERLRLEAVEEIFPGTKKYVVDSSSANSSLRLRLWNGQAEGPALLPEELRPPDTTYGEIK